MDEEGEALVIRKPWTATKQLQKLRYWLMVAMSEPPQDAAHGSLWRLAHWHVFLRRGSVRAVRQLPVQLQCKTVLGRRKDCRRYHIVCTEYPRISGYFIVDSVLF